MERSELKIQGICIASYQRQKPDSTPILFIHGNSSNAGAFEWMWNSQHLSNFSLHAFDLPGHGYSAIAKSSETYGIRNLGRLIAGYIKENNLNDVALFGHSLGGHFAMHSLEFNSRVKGIMLLGTSPLDNASDISKGYNLLPEVMTFFRASSTPEEVDKCASMEVVDQQFKYILKNSYQITDPLFREMIGQDLNNYLTSSEFVSEVKLLQSPILKVGVLHGEQDQIINLDYLHSLKNISLWRNKVQIIKDVGHCAIFEKPDETAALLRDFVLSL